MTICHERTSKSLEQVLWTFKCQLGSNLVFMIFENHWSRFRTSSLIFFRTTGHMSMYLTLTSRSFLWKERTAQHWLQLLVQFGALFCMMRERQCIDFESIDQMCLKDLATFPWEETMHWLWVNVMKAVKRPYTVSDVCLVGSNVCPVTT
jgi:hypothetical protein